MQQAPKIGKLYLNLYQLKSSSSHLNIRRLIHSKLFILNCSSIFCVAGKRGMVSEKGKKPACFAAQQATAALLLTHGERGGVGGKGPAHCDAVSGVD